jgi:aldehyde:ferredoxin oxidoreductase
MVCRLEEMLAPYYALRGWSPDGVPSEVKLRELGLL